MLENKQHFWYRKFADNGSIRGEKREMKANSMFSKSVNLIYVKTVVRQKCELNANGMREFFFYSYHTERTNSGIEE